MSELLTLEDKVLTMRNILVSRATGGGGDDDLYRALRKELLAYPELRQRLPAFVRSCQTLGDFWGFIKVEFGQYESRRTYLRDRFEPVFEYLDEHPELAGSASDYDAYVDSGQQATEMNTPTTPPVVPDHTPPAAVPSSTKATSAPPTVARQTKPRVFIGSSVEGLRIAEHIQLGLEYHCESTLWSQGVFSLSRGTLENLVEAAGQFDYAILVLTPDDMVVKRGESSHGPRDNVLFELGLFVGALGRDRTFIVVSRDDELALPTDLAGVTAATFASRSDGNLQAALGPVTTRLKQAITIPRER